MGVTKSQYMRDPCDYWVGWVDDNNGKAYVLDTWGDYNTDLGYVLPFQDIGVVRSAVLSVITAALADVRWSDWQERSDAHLVLSNCRSAPLCWLLFIVTIRRHDAEVLSRPDNRRYSGRPRHSECVTSSLSAAVSQPGLHCRVTWMQWAWFDSDGDPSTLVYQSHGITQYGAAQANFFTGAVQELPGPGWLDPGKVVVIVSAAIIFFTGCVRWGLKFKRENDERKQLAAISKQAAKLGPSVSVVKAVAADPPSETVTSSETVVSKTVVVAAKGRGLGGGAAAPKALSQIEAENAWKAQWQEFLHDDGVHKVCCCADRLADCCLFSTTTTRRPKRPCGRFLRCRMTGSARASSAWYAYCRTISQSSNDAVCRRSKSIRLQQRSRCRRFRRPRWQLSSANEQTRRGLRRGRCLRLTMARTATSTTRRWTRQPGRSRLCLRTSLPKFAFVCVGC